MEVSAGEVLVVMGEQLSLRNIENLLTKPR
jgi:hypothetical protein